MLNFCQFRSAPHFVCTVLVVPSNAIKNGSERKITKKIESPRHSQDSQFSQNSQKPRSKNYSDAECQGLVRCCDKFHTIISMNSNRDKDKEEKKKAWKKIQNDFSQYCKSQGIHVSENIIANIQFNVIISINFRICCFFFLK